MSFFKKGSILLFKLFLFNTKTMLRKRGVCVWGGSILVQSAKKKKVQTDT